MSLANINTSDFIKGSGVTQTGRVIEITGGGGGALDDLTDVTAPTPSDNDVLTWDSGTSKWVNQAPTGGTITVGDTQVLYADGANTPVGEAAFTYNKTTNTLTVDDVQTDALELALTQSMYLITR